ncbi:hypothetical protein [Actinocorallia sp. A-T 12471]|uniref:hypothetical protein n=1 Tax=Actinocorallia sp. A-T 12471 TaxID=3089813 RepID=UPI0029CEB397|nr:hypothetical protein [Actinocorallia sp. A-T 12471]MDX6741433.1 hypothetical protein [Actinocorallia sp. A-T 12471]
MTVPDPQEWERELSLAFEALLDRPLGDYPTTAEYAHYAWNDEMSFLLIEDLVGGDLDPAALLTPPGEAAQDVHAALSWDRWPVDHANSLWVVEADLCDPYGPLGEHAGPALAEVASGADFELTVSGADLLRVLAEHRADLAGVDPDELTGRVQWLQRITTDGTLPGALRSATWTAHGPGGLVTFDADVKVKPKFDKALRRISDPALRDHLRMLCLTEYWARSRGGYYLGPGRCPHELGWIAELPGHETVAGWTYGEGQASTAVFQIKRPAA